MGGWMDGWMDGWLDAWATFLCWTTFWLNGVFTEPPLLSATSPLMGCLCSDLALLAPSLRSATVSCTFCRPHLPKVLSASRTPQFWPFSIANQALATVSCTFCRPHLPKVLSASRTPQFWPFSIANQALATVSCTFCRPHLPKVLGCRTAETEILNRRPEEPHYPQKDTCEFKCSRTAPQLLDGGGLTCWGGWHDGGTAKYDSRRNSEVF